MTEQIITLETAKLAKEKGFTEEVGNFYKNNNKNPWSNSIAPINLRIGEKSQDNIYPRNYNSEIQNRFKDVYYSAPTQSLLQKWLREKHNISVLVEHGMMEDESFGYFCRIFTNTKKGGVQFKVFEYKNIYEDALEIGLQEVLKIIK